MADHILQSQALRSFRIGRCTSQPTGDFEQRPVDDCGWLIHGHVHDRWKVSRRQINVSVEVWNFEPVSLEAIAALIESGPVAPPEAEGQHYE